MMIVFITLSLMNNKPELLYNSADTQAVHYLPQWDVVTSRLHNILRQVKQQVTAAWRDPAVVTARAVYGPCSECQRSQFACTHVLGVAHDG